MSTTSAEHQHYDEPSEHPRSMGGVLGTRVDAAHVRADALAAWSADDAADAQAAIPEPAPVAGSTIEQVRSQAGQLAAQLQRQQAAIDHRESELNARLAAMEHHIRGARLWLNERQAAIAAQKADLERRERELARREGEGAGGHSAKSKKSAPQPADIHEEDLLARSAELDRRQAELEELAARLSDEVSAGRQVQMVGEASRDVERRRDHIMVAEKLLANQQRELERQQRQHAADRAEAWARIDEKRQKLAHDEQQALAQYEGRRVELDRQGGELAARATALAALEAEVGRSQQEALETRLAAEELWARMCGTATPAALAQSLAQVRLKLDERQRLAQAEAAQQSSEMRSLSDRLSQQHEKLTLRRQELHAWANQRQKDLEEQASRLAVAEEQIERRRAELDEQALAWQHERFQLQQEMRSLLAGQNRELPMAA